MSWIKEFKEFASKGNAIDLAVGVVVGAAFGAIVTSLVNDIIMPPIGYILSGINFSDLKAVLSPEHMQGAKKVPEAAIYYGKFIQTLINFIIIAFCIFMMVKGINLLKKEKEAAPAAPPEPSPTEKLLSEIRDELKKQ